jgi:hypothetical protein
MTAYDVHDKDGFLKLVNQMRDELTAGAVGWENVELAAFLEAMSAWAIDWPHPAAANPWAHAAMLLEAGAKYE